MTVCWRLRDRDGLFSIGGRFLVRLPDVAATVTLRMSTREQEGLVAALLVDCLTPRTIEELIERGQRRGQTAEATGALHGRCVALALLEEVEGERALGARRNGPVTELLSVLGQLPQADYADERVFDMDDALMHQYVDADGPAAGSCAPPSTSPRTWLQRPPWPPGPGLADRLGRLLYFAAAVVRDVRLGAVMAAVLKAVPSHGARHPIDVHLRVGAGGPFAAGWHSYRPDDHTLTWQAEASDAPAGSVAMVLVAVWERVQWRYRSSLAYPTVFLDAGHLTGTLQLLAPELALCLREGESIAPPCGAPLERDVILRLDAYDAA